MISNASSASRALAAAFALTLAACAKDNADRKPRAQNEAAQPASAEAPQPEGPSTPSTPSTPAAAATTPAEPLEKDDPNVPEFEPAFAGQTRAPEARSQTRFEVRELAGEFEKPWAIAFLPDRRMLVTEKPTGKLFIVSPSGEKSAAVRGIPKVDGRGQGGLLDVEIAPDYATSSFIYFSYYEPRKGGNGLAVARGRLVDGAAPRIDGLQVVFRMQPTLDSTMHAGGRLVFAPDGKLFAVLGERSIAEGRKQARDPASHFGKVVRIEPDGKVPADNPFVGRAGTRPEIWTSGHRNMLAAALDDKQRLWVVEMGPQGGDELNLVEKGRDYGWPTIGYGEEYSGARIHDSTQAPGLEQPIYYWDPVISPSGLVVYSGKLAPEWKGNFFIGALSKKALVRLVVQNDRVVGEEHLLKDRGDRIREVVEGPDGALYLLTDDDDGKLLVLTPSAAATPNP